MKRFLDRHRACRHHWCQQPSPGLYGCCWCPETAADTTRPAHRTAECLALESFLLTLPPVRSIRARRPARRGAAV